MATTRRSAKGDRGPIIGIALFSIALGALFLFGALARTPLYLPFVLLARIARTAVLAAYAVAPVLVLGSAFARRFLAPCRARGPALRLGVDASSGLALLALLAVALLASGWYHEWVFVVLAAAGNVALAVGLARRRFQPARQLWAALSRLLHRLAGGVGGLSAVLLVLFGLATLYGLVPPDTRDEITYHLLVPRLWAIEHGWWLPRDNFHWWFPGHVEILWGYAMAVGGIQLPRALSLLLVVLTVALLREWMEEAGFAEWTRRASLVFLLVTPLFLAVAPLCYVEWPLLLFLFLGWRAAREYARAPDRAWLALAGLAWGASLATKYSAIPVVGLLVLEWAVALLLKRRIGAALAVVGAVALGALVLAGPWWLRNLAATGDPVFPLGQRLQWVSSRAAEPVEIGPLVGYAALSGPWRIDPLLYHATLDRTSDHRLHPAWPLLHLVVLGLGWRWVPTLPWLTVLGLTPLLFAYTPSPRIYLPLLLLTWLFLPVLLEAVGRHRAGRWLATASLGLCVLASLPPVAHFWFLSGKGAVLEYLLGMTGAAGVLRREGVITPAVEWVARNAPAEARLWVWCDDRVLYFDRWARADAPYGKPAFARLVERHGAEALTREVARDRIDLIAVNTENCPLPLSAVKTERGTYPIESAASAELAAWMDRHLEPVTVDGRFRVYRVAGEGR